MGLAGKFHQAMEENVAPTGRMYNVDRVYIYCAMMRNLSTSDYGNE